MIAREAGKENTRFSIVGHEGSAALYVSGFEAYMIVQLPMPWASESSITVNSKFMTHASKKAFTLEDLADVIESTPADKDAHVVPANVFEPLPDISHLEDLDAFVEAASSKGLRKLLMSRAGMSQAFICEGKRSLTSGHWLIQSREPLSEEDNPQNIPLPILEVFKKTSKGADWPLVSQSNKNVRFHGLSSEGAVISLGCRRITDLPPPTHGVQDLFYPEAHLKVDPDDLHAFFGYIGKSHKENDLIVLSWSSSTPDRCSVLLRSIKVTPQGDEACETDHTLSCLSRCTASGPRVTTLSMRSRFGGQ